MVRAFIVPSDFFNILIRLFIFFYGLATLIQIVLDYLKCTPATSAYNITSASFIISLAFIHYVWHIHCWFHFMLEAIQIVMILAFAIWGFIQFSAITVDNCSTRVRSVTIQLLSIQMVLFVFWLLTGAFRIFQWSKIKDIAKAKFTLNVAEINECMVRVGFLTVLLIIFGLVANTNGSNINDLWLSSLVLGTLFIQCSVTIILWRFDTIIQVVLECMLYVWVFIWMCLGWDSYRQANTPNNDSKVSSAVMLTTITVIMILWFYSLYLRINNFNKEYKEGYSKVNQLSVQEKEAEIEQENSSYTDYKFGFFFPPTTKSDDHLNNKKLDNE